MMRATLHRLGDHLAAVAEGPVRGSLFAVILFLAGGITTVVPVVGADFRYLPGDLVDNRLNNYILEQGYRWLNRQQKEFWQAPFCYPARYVTTSSDAHIGNLPIYAGFRFVGAGPERAFQLWWLSTFPLTFAATVWAIRRLGGCWVGASVAAVVFTFNPIIQVSAGHAQLFPRYFLPVAVAYGWQYLTRPSSGRLFGVTVAWLGQVYCTVYIGYFLTLLLGTMTLAAVLTGQWAGFTATVGDSWAKRFTRFLVLAAVGLGLVPLLKPYLAPDRHAAPPDAATVISLLPKPTDWLRASPTSASWAWTSDVVGLEYTPLGPPFFLFPGAFGAAAAMAVVPLWIVGRRPPLRTAAGIGLAGWVLGFVVMHTEEVCPYRPLTAVPFAGSVRGLFRVGTVVLFPLAVVVGLGVSEWLPRRVWLRALLVPVLAAAVVIDVRSKSASSRRSGVSRVGIDECVARRTAFADALRAYPDARIVYAFSPSPDMHPTLITQMDVMWACQMLNLATVNGWTGHWPEGWHPFTSYSDLFHWLRTHSHFSENGPPPGFLIMGSPTGPAVDDQERSLRTRYPSVPFPSMP